MLSKPILFSAPMVRALLDGSKTQTRRIWKMPKWAECDIQAGGESAGLVMSKKHGEGFSYDLDEIESPYGRPGDQLWVRETWAHHVAALVARTDEDGPFVYAADGDLAKQTRLDDKWKPSIHMFKWASRITLGVTGIRVERLNDCSEADAIAEGVEVEEITKNGNPIYQNYDHPEPRMALPYVYAKESYKSLWESINGAGSWASNPWVWVIEFKVLKPATVGYAWDEKRIDTIGQNGNDGLHY